MALTLLSTAAVGRSSAIPKTAQRYVDAFKLARQPYGNYFASTFNSNLTVGTLDPGRFPGGTRGLSADIYNLFASDGGGGMSQRGFPLHRLTQDETWHFYDGAFPILHPASNRGREAGQDVLAVLGFGGQIRRRRRILGTLVARMFWECSRGWQGGRPGRSGCARVGARSAVGGEFWEHWSPGCSGNARTLWPASLPLPGCGQGVSTCQ